MSEISEKVHCNVKKSQNILSNHNNNNNNSNTNKKLNDDSSGLQGTNNVLCTHDGVLLKKIITGHISDLNTSGALSLVENLATKELYLEWQPNESILIADDSQDQGEWALVDTISQRPDREFHMVNSKSGISETNVNNDKRHDSESQAVQSDVIRTPLQILSHIEVKNRGQTLRCIGAKDGNTQSEYFFQHGNADLFVRSMRHLHVIDYARSRGKNNRTEEYEILNRETQKLKKTFAELDIGDIKASTIKSDSWLPNSVVGFLVNIPEYVAPQFNRSPLISRPVSFDSPEMLDEIVLKSKQRRNSSRSPQDSRKIESEVNITKALPERVIIPRGEPLSEEQFIEFMTPDGSVSNSNRLREIIFRGGIEDNLRAEVWKYLLNYYQWEDTYLERIQRRENKSKEYYTMKAQWLSMTMKQEANFSGYRERKCQIDKDVKRTDRTIPFFAGEENPNILLLQNILMTYVMYNFDLGYVQGMSDLLAPILSIEENEVDAFWCFVGFMDMVLSNFEIEQTGMKLQFNQLHCVLKYVNSRLFNHMLARDSDNMYFCFRWLLVWYKREFSNGDILRLWECLWTQLPCPNFHLLISVAILEQQTDIIISNDYEFTEILKHVNELSGSINLERTLTLAESIYHQLMAVDDLPNDICKIIGKPLTNAEETDSKSSDERDFDDGFDEIVPQLTLDEQHKKEELLEEAYERSMFLQYS